MATQYVSKSLTASSVATSATMNTEYILFIANDSLSTDLYVSFENDASADYIVLKPSESITNVDVQCASLYYKTLSGSAPFRVLALNR